MHTPSPSDRLPKQSVIVLPEDKSLEELLKEGGFTQNDFRDALEDLGLEAYVNALFFGVAFKISNYPEGSNLRIAISVGLKALRDGVQDSMSPSTGAYRLPGAFHEDLKSKSLEELMGDVQEFLSEVTPGEFPDVSLSIIRSFWTQKLSKLREEAPNAYKIVLKVLHAKGIVIVDGLTSEVREKVAESLTPVAPPQMESEKPLRLSVIDTHGDKSGLTVEALKKYLDEQKKSEDGK